MKAKVTYYDIEVDKVVEKECECFHVDYGEDEFSFTPIDNPPTIYKSRTVLSPKISTTYSMLKVGATQKVELL